LDDTKVNISDNDYVTLFKFDTNDRKYHTIDNKKTIVSEILNEESSKKGYEKRWDRKLVLRTPINIHIGGIVNRNIEVFAGLTLDECGVPDDILDYHLVPNGITPTTANEITKDTVIEESVDLTPYYMIKISGEVSQTVYIEADGKQHKVSENEELKNYLESKDYTIGDIDTNAILNDKTKVDGDINIVVMKKNTVVIDVEPETVLAVDVNLKEIAESISALTGISVENILIDIEVDENGYVIQIIVIVSDYEMSEEVVSSVNELVKDDSNCQSGVLCHSREARIVVGDISSSSRINAKHLLLLMVITITVMLW